MAIALRPRPSASAISSRYGSQALAVGARPGGDGRRGRWTPPRKWPVLAGRSRWTPPAWWPVLKDPGRWTPPVWWPVLAATPLAGHRARAPGSRPPSDRRWPSRGGPWWPARCAAATIPVAPAPVLAAVCCRPRRCSWRRRNMRSSPASTSRLLRVVAGFQVSISGRFWVSTEPHAKPALRPTDQRPARRARQSTRPPDHREPTASDTGSGVSGADCPGEVDRAVARVNGRTVSGIQRRSPVAASCRA